MISQRYAIIGTTGSGKSTVAREAASRLVLKHIELDALFWGPNWSKLDDDQLREKVKVVTNAPVWVVDGNYSRVRDIVWSRAETLVWLDYPLPLILWQLWWRTLKRVFLRQRLWNDNRKNFQSQFLSRRSLFLWVVKTHPEHRKEYPSLLVQSQYAHLSLIHLRSPRTTRNWLGSLRR